MSDSQSENQAKEGRSWPVLIAWGIGLTLLVLVSAEVGVRLEDLARWDTPFMSQVTGVDDLIMTDAAGKHPRPDSRFRKWRINHVGTRGDEIDQANVDRRVLVLGASETFGMYESPDHEFPRQLQDSLRAGGCAVDVLNAGFAGMSLPTVIQDLRLRLAEIHPRVVVYYPTPQQYLDEKLPVATKPDSSKPGSAVRTAFKSRFAVRVRSQLKLMLPRFMQDKMRQRDIDKARVGKAGDWFFRDVPADRMDAFERDLRQLVGTMKSLNAVPVLMTHANGFVGTTAMSDDVLRAWERYYPRALGSTIVAFDSVATLRIQQVAKDSGLTVIDAWRTFHDGPALNYFSDFSHFTDAGAARMAALLRSPVATRLQCP